jgi:hypothetical protein
MIGMRPRSVFWIIVKKFNIIITGINLTQANVDIIVKAPKKPTNETMQP